jgi:restriction system protein
MTPLNYRDHRIYLVHLLRVLNRRGASPPADVYEEVADLAGVTPEERAVPGKEVGWNPVYRNRIQFARQGLVDAGLVVGSSDPGWRRGIWELTPAGIQLASTQQSDATLDAQIKERAAEGLSRRTKERQESFALAGLETELPAEFREPENGSAADADEAGPTVQDLVEVENDAVLRSMLDHVRGMSDRAFEYLVGTVLKAALRAESVKITQRSRDGGVDGMLFFDALGMRLGVFEAKRYADGNVVCRPLVDAFATAARRHRASHSLFVTSSRFSAEAVDAARDEGIRLIEGMAFVELMAQHGIGLRAKDTFVLYELDPAWSVNDLEDAD